MKIKSKEQQKLEKDMAKQNPKEKYKKELELKGLSPTQEQMLSSKYKYESKLKITEMWIELEKLKHKNIMEEIEKLFISKIISFKR